MSNLDPRQEIALLQKKIVALEARYEKLYEVTGDAVLRHRGEALVDCNQATLRMFGLKSIEDLRAFRCIADLSPERQPCGGRSMDLAFEKIAPVMSTGIARFEWLHQRLDGTTFPAEITVSALNANDEYTSQSIVRDLSVPKQLESDLARHRHAMDAASEGMGILTEELVFDYVNSRLAELAGVESPRELVGRTMAELATPAELDKARAGLARRGAWRGRFKRKREGAPDQVLDAGMSRLAAGGVVLVLSDVTAELEAERAQSSTEKFEAIGRLTGTLAHDFNNVLRAIQLTAETHVQEKASGERSEQLLDRVMESTRRATAWLSDLLAVSRTETLGAAGFDAHAAIRSMATILKPSLGTSVDLRLRLAAGSTILRGDVARLERMLMNLATNARDAMPAGGTLTIATENVGNAVGGEASGLRIVVEDTGSGMDEKTLERIFEPFFTTKPRGKGTGLGLAMIRRHVVEMGGTVDVRSAPGKGTSFRLDFPVYVRADREPVVALPIVTAPPVVRTREPGRKPCVLLADDDTAFRIALTERFLRAGVDVVTDEDGGAALETYRERGDRIDWVVLDLDMPRLGGRETLQRLLLQDAGAQVLILSSDVPAALEQTLLGEGARHVARKSAPFEEILAAMALAQGVGSAPF